ncbi:DUF4238 domain-containing protein [Komagataeibacter oboediens]|uniref:DUF4238 domain-containing protein n=1 Tax=Komagataeibacter oboediens TaxID=65958 RepID=UPI0012F4B6A6|nr:DUF4238 domain-containing protein [Komagataeibacter oboediens]
MNNKPRHHHFVPQFWIRNFSNTSGEIYGYDWEDDRTRLRSSKNMMEIYDLYTIDPEGSDDTTLEEKDLSIIDTEGALAFQSICKKQYGFDVKEKLSNFFPVQIMRDPKSFRYYNVKSGEFASFLIKHSTTQTFLEFTASLDEKFPGSKIDKGTYDGIKNVVKASSESDLEKFIAQFKHEGNSVQLPATDLVRSPEGRIIIQKIIINFEWTMKISSEENIILGDNPILFLNDDINSGIKIPISCKEYLMLSPSKNPHANIQEDHAKSYEISALNYESAAKARRWIVGKNDLLEDLKKQLNSDGFL